MDPRHKLYKQLDSLTLGSERTMSENNAQSAAASSGVTPELITAKLEEGLGATHVEIADLSGT